MEADKYIINIISWIYSPTLFIEVLLTFIYWKYQSLLSPSQEFHIYIYIYIYIIPSIKKDFTVLVVDNMKVA